MYQQYQPGWLEVITGPMFAGKSEELIRRIRTLSYAKKSIVCFKPAIDDRYAKEEIASHAGNMWEAKAVKDVSEIKEFLKIYPDINIMILSERFNLNQRKREIYNYILNDFRKLGFELKLHLNTNPSFNDNTFNNQKNEIENIICDCVINYLETKTFKI